MKERKIIKNKYIFWKVKKIKNKKTKNKVERMKEVMKINKSFISEKKERIPLYFIFMRRIENN